jgi:hypothetical protein
VNLAPPATADGVVLVRHSRDERTEILQRVAEIPEHCTLPLRQVRLVPIRVRKVLLLGRSHIGRQSDDFALPSNVEGYKRTLKTTTPRSSTTEM